VLDKPEGPSLMLGGKPGAHPRVKQPKSASSGQAPGPTHKHQTCFAAFFKHILPFHQATALILKIDPALPTSIKSVSQYKARKVIYDVVMTTPYASQEIRDAYGLFWRKKSGKRLPNDLKGISFSNSTTFSTRVRLRLLKELCRRHQAANPDLSCYVTSYMARPELRIRERRGMVTSLTYAKAIQQLSHHLTLSFLQELYKYAKTNLPEKEIAERFLILTPDLLLGSAPEAQPQPMVVDDPPPSSPHPTRLEPPVSQCPSPHSMSLLVAFLCLRLLTLLSLPYLLPLVVLISLCSTVPQQFRPLASQGPPLCS